MIPKLGRGFLCLVALVSSASAEEKKTPGAPVREALVWVVSWMSPVGGIHDSEMRWGRDNYAYLRYRGGEEVNFPADLDGLPKAAPEYASDAFYRIQREGALRDLRLMKEGGFDVAVYDMQPESSFQPGQPLSPFNRPLKNFRIFEEWLDAAKEAGLKAGIGLSVVMPSPNVEGMVERLSTVLDAVGNQPALWKIGGKPVIMGFGTSTTGWRKFAPDPQAPDPDGGWRDILGGLREGGRDPYFIAHAMPNDPSPEVWKTFADAVWIFGPAASLAYQVDMHAHLSRSLGGEIPVVWSVSPGYYSGRLRAWTPPDFARIHTAYQAAMEADATSICVLTWNDFLEDTDIVPSANKGRALFDVFAYYNEWFKTDRQPKIDRERIILAYPKTIPSKILSESGADRYRPTVYYWALLNEPRTVFFGNQSVTLAKGLSFGEMGDASPGSVAVRVGDRVVSAPAVQSADSEGSEVEGIFEGHGLQYRYLDLLPEP
jgi:hypothetical protein